jgi:hypothetical protein
MQLQAAAEIEAHQQQGLAADELHPQAALDRVVGVEVARRLFQRGLRHLRIHLQRDTDLLGAAGDRQQRHRKPSPRSSPHQNLQLTPKEAVDCR